MPENIWRVFEDTGDPLCYLLYKAENRLAPLRTKTDAEINSVSIAKNDIQLPYTQTQIKINKVL